jgi:very-short-patch-repair endonuclease
MIHYMSKRKKKKNGQQRYERDAYRKRDTRSKATKRRDWFEAKARDLRVMPSPAEAALWEFLKTQRTGHLFHWNYAYPPYILDFVCFNSALIVEIDGEFHSGQTLADEERDRFFARKGAKTMRFMAKDVVADPQSIVKLIVATCVERHGIPSAL